MNRRDGRLRSEVDAGSDHFRGGSAARTGNHSEIPADGIGTAMKHGSLKLLSQITQLGIMMLTPIILCTLLGVWLDGLWQCSPWISLGGALLGIAAAFRNLFVWNGKMTRQAQNTQDPLRPKGAQEDDGNEK